MLQVLAIDRAIMIYLHPFQGAHCSRRSVPRATLPLALGWFTNAPSGRIAYPTKLQFSDIISPPVFCQHGSPACARAWPWAGLLTPLGRIAHRTKLPILTHHFGALLLPRRLSRLRSRLALGWFANAALAPSRAESAQMYQPRASASARVALGYGRPPQTRALNGRGSSFKPRLRVRRKPPPFFMLQVLGY